MKIRTVPYYGGKYRMLRELLKMIPDCKRWYDLFGGSAAVTLNRRKSPEETINEFNINMYTLLKVLQDDNSYKEFIKRMENLEYDSNVFEKAKNSLRSENVLSEVERAFCTFVLYSQSYNNTGQNFSKKDAVNNYRYNNILNHYFVHQRLKGVNITKRVAQEMLAEIKNDKEAFVFLDPPYPHDYRGKGADKAYGDFEMEDDEYKTMLEIAVDAECKILICGYRAKDGSAELYDSILRKNSKWHCYLLKDIHKPNKGGERAKEYIWVNYDLPSYARYFISMKDVYEDQEK